MTGARIVQLAESKIGQRYVLGSRVDYQDVTWAGPWDCAELATWAVYQAIYVLHGVTADGDAYSGAWASMPRGVVSPEQAAATPGAILVRRPGGPERSGHVAISTGNGRTVEAHSSRLGVVAHSAVGRRWDLGIMVPGVQYADHPPFPLAVPRVLRIGSRGHDVLHVQSRLSMLGYDPGPIDGIFGEKTHSAVLLAQAAFGLVVDGEVGAQTTAAIQAPIQL